MKEYMAQTLGAQYAWQRPRAKGKRRLRTWGIWFLAAKGPKAAAKIAPIPPPSLTQFNH